MAGVTIETLVDPAQAELILKDYPERSTRALVRGLNRGIASARTFMVRSISADTRLKSSTVREALPMQNATAARPEAKLRASLKRIPLKQFNARQTRSGVSARLPGGSGRYPHAFLATLKSGHEGVFQRVKPSRSRAGLPSPSNALPIYELYGPSLGRVFAKYRAGALARGEEMVRKNLAHELQFEASTLGSDAVGEADAGTD